MCQKCVLFSQFTAPPLSFTALHYSPADLILLLPRRSLLITSRSQITTVKALIDQSGELCEVTQRLGVTVGLFGQEWTQESQQQQQQLAELEELCEQQQQLAELQQQLAEQQQAVAAQQQVLALKQRALVSKMKQELATSVTDEC